MKNEQGIEIIHDPDLPLVTVILFSQPPEMENPDSDVCCMKCKREMINKAFFATPSQVEFMAPNHHLWCFSPWIIERPDTRPSEYL